jgi:NAD(P)H-hydrate repair Nnr-like enzyme with NAD(P)H-hydrate dehydratase domain
MASTVDEITMNYEENGQQLVKELDKVVLTKGAWSTVMFKYQAVTDPSQSSTSVMLARPKKSLRP